MSGGADVGSIEAIRDFRAALVIFLHEARQAMCSHDLEIRRTLDWLLEDEPKRWQQAVRDCEEKIVEAKIELERCRHTKLPGGEAPSCIEERKALERARQRRQYAEQKVELVRKWGHVVEREVDEYGARANQLNGLFDVELVAAVGTLDRALTALESYTALRPESAPMRASLPPTAQPPAIGPVAVDGEPARGMPAAPDRTAPPSDQQTGDNPAPGEEQARHAIR